ARFRAAPGSGTDAGGTGGGLSVVLNICAEATAGITPISVARSATTTARRRPDPPMPLPPRFMAMLFTENAANSSLAVATRHPNPAEHGNKVSGRPGVVVQAFPSPLPRAPQDRALDS